MTKNTVIKCLMMVQFFFLSLGNAHALRPEAIPQLLPGLIWDEHVFGLLSDLTRLISNAEGLKVMWWNVKYCDEDKRWQARNGTQPLKINLETLIGTELKPDILILGEYHPTKCHTQLNGLLEAIYPHTQFTPYNPRHPELGIQVYSLYRFQSEEPHSLDWTPPGLRTEAEREQYRQSWRTHDQGEVDLFERHYRPLKFTFARNTFSIIPLHFVEPWVLYKEEHGSLRTFYEMAYGMESPLAHQLIRFRTHLKSDFGQNFERSPFLAIGDANIPQSIDLTDEDNVDRTRVATPALYRRMSRGLTEAFDIRDTRPESLVNLPWTFPARGCAKRQDFPFTQWLPKIDHALLSPQARSMYRARGILPLRGSDHYPLYLILNVW